MKRWGKGGRNKATNWLADASGSSCPQGWPINPSNQSIQTNQSNQSSQSIQSIQSSQSNQSIQTTRLTNPTNQSNPIILDQKLLFLQQDWRSIYDWIAGASYLIRSKLGSHVTTQYLFFSSAKRIDQNKPNQSAWTELGRHVTTQSTNFLNVHVPIGLQLDLNQLACNAFRPNQSKPSQLICNTCPTPFQQNGLTKPNQLESHFFSKTDWANQFNATKNKFCPPAAQTISL